MYQSGTNIQCYCRRIFILLMISGVFEIFRLHFWFGDMALIIMAHLHALFCLTLRLHGMVACQAPLSLEFFRQEYWSGLSFPPPGNLPEPGINPKSPVSSALQADS